MKKISLIYHSHLWIRAFVRKAAILAVLVFVQISFASACACCTEVGQRNEGVREIDDIQRDVLQSIKFTSRAQLVGNEDDVRGLINLSIDGSIGSFEYVLASKVAPHLLTFELSQDGQERGKIIFPLPDAMTLFEVDTRDMSSSENGLGPLLYREWRLTGSAILTGMVSEGAHTADIRLILQGRGNSCPNVQDFSHWSLVAEGKDIQFELIGDMQGNY